MIDLLALQRAGGPRLGASGVVLAVASAGCYDLGYLLERSGLSKSLGDRTPASAQEALRAGLGSARWRVGFVLMLGGLGLQVLALSLAPLDVVQPISAAGLVALAGLSGPVLGERLRPRMALGLALALASMMAFSLSVPTGSAPARDGSLVMALTAMVPGAAAAALLAWWGRQSEGGRSLLGLLGAAGTLYGLGALAEKFVGLDLARRGLLAGSWEALAGPYPYIFALFVGGGLVAFQLGLARHPAALAAGITNVVASVVTILGAAAVFGEKVLPAGLDAGLRVTGLVTLASAAAVLALAAVPGTQSPTAEQETSDAKAVPPG